MIKKTTAFLFSDGLFTDTKKPEMVRNVAGATENPKDTTLIMNDASPDTNSAF